MLRLIAVALIAVSAPAMASTWTDADYKNMETPIDDRERPVFENSIMCDKQPKDGREFYKSRGVPAFFVVSSDGSISRIWGPYAERVAIDYCDQ
jgi:hypothetical protein